MTSFEIVPERPPDAPLVEGLVARALGPGRFAKTAERLREGSRPIAGLSFVAWRGGEALGCVRLWPIAIGETPALLLGPLAVEGHLRGEGIGKALVSRACGTAAKGGHRLVLLVGDLPYYGPLGFAVAPGVSLPGPADSSRVLVRALVPGAEMGLAGQACAAPEQKHQIRDLAAAAS